MKQLAAWYQKKISSYDKEEWETMVEQLLMRGTYRRRIVDFSSHPRSYLIDVDLVRGSSFPKAKPTLSMRRVIWYALVRLLFFPALYQWWTQQTSPACAKFLLTLWLMQVLNITIHFMSPDTAEKDPHCWLVPLGLMLVLSVVHSQIVSTTEMELARVRPRSTFRRKLPRHFRRGRDCDGGSGGSGVGSAESGATSSQSKTPTTKPAKFRRRQSRTEIAENGLRKRKKDLTKEHLIKNMEPTKNKTSTKMKAKDSDDEDYMVWKKPDLTAPIVTFTPPPDDATPSTSFRYKPNVLTKKQLESFNVRQNQQIPNSRALADGDDGFESLNGYNSNGSEGERVKNETENLIQKEKTTSTEQTNENATEENTPKTKLAESPKATTKNEEPKTIEPIKAFVKSNIMKKEEDEKSLESDGVAPTSSPNTGKRIGVRFRSSWAQEDIRIHESSDDDFPPVNKKKDKKLDNYQSSSSDGECSASAPSIALPSHHTMSDWVGQTTNSEESSYCSQSEGGHSDVDCFPYTGDSSWDPFAILNPTSDTVKCTMWERGSTLRAELSAVDISWYVVARAERAQAADGCLWAGIAMAAAVAVIKPILRFAQVAAEQDTRTDEELQALSVLTYFPTLMAGYKGSFVSIFFGAFGDNIWLISTNILSSILRFALGALVFFLLAVAERAFKQRFLYAKLFSHLTSARRARKSELPHFRLNTVRNIKTWLSTRSYLRRRGPQRSVEVIVSAAFMLLVVLLGCVSTHLLRDTVTSESGWVLEVLLWSLCIGIYLLRLGTLGSNVNKKYRGCLSAILTEQINLHLAIEQRPESKEQLMLANNVLKLAADLLKELDAPFKISSLCANHYLYTITKVVILSALSGVLSEMLGFKLKLHKIKIK
ncbi:hypothetical protein PYW07_017132 [Mythimna separata]|uniref:PHTF1/2 N-terminal domain-containing protein n=1 Tax=Mythimna separata TaxID=271217 RepID=A0AAD7YX53_MYTSE|nr:hypothetical protein PYW07_017132 [Mythimna separata]